MSTSTPNYGLTKPDPSEYYDINVFNDNFDKIDDAIKDASSSGSGVLYGTSTSEDNSTTMVVTFDEATLEKFGNDEVANGTICIIKFVNGWHPFVTAGSNVQMHFNINNSNYRVWMDGHNTKECGIEIEKNGIITVVYNTSDESFSFVSSSSNSIPSILTENRTNNVSYYLLFQYSACHFRSVFTSNKLTFNPNTGTIILNGSMSVSGTLTTNNLTLNNTLTAETIIANTFKSKDIGRTSNVSMRTYPGKSLDIYLNAAHINNSDRGLNIRRQFTDEATRVRFFSVPIKLSGESSIVSASSCAVIDISGYISSGQYFTSPSASTGSTVDRGLAILYGGSRAYPVLSQESGNTATIGDNYDTIVRMTRYEYYDDGTRSISKSDQVHHNFAAMRIGDKDKIDNVMVESRNCIIFQTYPPESTDSDYSSRRHPDRDNENLYSYIAFSVHGGMSSKPQRQADGATKNYAQLVLRSSCATIRYPIDKIKVKATDGDNGAYHDLNWFFPKRTVITIAHNGSDFEGDYTAYDVNTDKQKTIDKIIKDHLEKLDTDEIAPSYKLVHFIIYPGTYVVSDTIPIFRENTIIEGINWDTVLVTPNDVSTDGFPIFDIDDYRIGTTTYQPKNIFIRNLYLKHGGMKDNNHTNGCLVRGSTTGSGRYNFYTIDNVFFDINEDHWTGSSISQSGTSYNNNASAIYMPQMENLRIMNCWFKTSGEDRSVYNTSAVIYISDWGNRGGYIVNSNMAQYDSTLDYPWTIRIISPADSNGYSFSGNIGFKLLTTS